MPTNDDTNPQVVARLKEMGFPEDVVRRALEAHNWDEVAAVNSLFSG